MNGTPYIAPRVSEVEFPLLSIDNLINRLERSVPSDVIYLTRKTDKMLTDLWSIPQRESRGTNECYIPSDLFHTHTIPLMDCKIIVDETKDVADGAITEARVKIYPEYTELLKSAPDGTSVMVGVVQYIVPDGYVALPIIMSPDREELGFTVIGYINKHGKTLLTEKASTATQIMWLCLATWYGIQIALLHPVVRDIFNNPGRSVVEKEKTKKPKSKKNRKPTPVKYVKRHFINSTEFEKLVYGESGSKPYKRKALIWYVIGHWRTYKNGKRVFVQPHWKGALRDTKLTQSREREIVLN